MDLKTFVSETLCQIQEGVEDAIRRRAGSPGVINPHYSKFDEDTKKIIEKVDFDVAITVSEGEENAGKAGIRVYGIGAGVETTGSKQSETVSRVKFAVPIVAPTTNVQRDKSANDDSILAEHRRNAGRGIV